MTLYRLDEKNRIAAGLVMGYELEALISGGVLVPVEPCEHGNIDGHHPYYQTEKMDPTYCPGAGIGDNDATVS